MPTPTHTQSSGPELLVDLRLPPDQTSPARARHALNPLHRRFDPDTLFKLRLLVSELVTNSVRHAHLDRQDLISVRVLVEPRALRVEVLDAGSGFPPQVAVLAKRGWHIQRAADPDRPGGWGLGIVDTLADSWGVVSNDLTTVWFELRLEAPDRS